MKRHHASLVAYRRAPFHALLFVLVAPLLLAGLLASGCTAFLPPLEERISRGSFLPRQAGEYRLTEQAIEIPPQRFYATLGDAAGPFLGFGIERVFVFAYAGAPPARTTLRGVICLLRSPLEAWGLESRLLQAHKGAGTDSASPPGPPGFFFAREGALIRIANPVEDPSGAAADALTRALNDALPGRRKTPREVEAMRSLSPTAGEPAYEPTVLLGSPLLAPGLASPLTGTPGGGGALVFLSVKGEAADAQRAFENYLADRATGRKGVSFTLGIGEVAGTAWDETFGWVSLAREGRMLVGVAGLPDPGEGWPLVLRLLAALNRVLKNP